MKEWAKTNGLSASVSEKSIISRQGLAYASPVLPLYFLFSPIVLLQGIYAKYFGLGLATIATVLLISRLFDAVSDPIIGYFSDRYYARRETRKPFIVSGGLLFIVASWFLYVPFNFNGIEHSGSVGSGYFLVWFLVFYFAYTLFEIPHLAWGGDLSSNSKDKNKIYGFRSFCFFLGGLLFYAMPLLPWFESTEFTPETLKWSVMAAGLLMLPMLYLCVKTVPEKSQLSVDNHCHPTDGKRKKESLRSVLRAIFNNKPLRLLTAAHTCTGFGSSMCYTLLFFFADAYLGLGKEFALAFVISFGLSIVTLKLWYALAMRWGKQVSWMTGMALVVIGMLCTLLLSPETTGWIELLFCMTLISGGFAAFNIMVPSLLSDIVDYGTWQSGTNRAATYFSLYTFINKTVGALGGAAGLAIAGWYGFEPTLSTHSEETIIGLRLGFSWIPAVMILLSIVFINYIPITARNHAAICRRLDARATSSQRPI